MKTIQLLLFFVFIFPSHLRALPQEFSALNVLNSSEVSLKLADGQNKVLVFLSAKCPCSESHEEMLSSLAKEFGTVKFFGVHSNSNESISEAKDHFTKSKLPFLVLHDRDAKIADAFAALKTPHAFIVDPKGEVVFSGGVSNAAHAPMASKHYLREALLSVSKGEKPNPSVVRSLGCVIARP